MLRKKLESESGTEIADFGFLIIYEKPTDSGSRIRIAIKNIIKHNSLSQIRQQRHWLLIFAVRFRGLMIDQLIFKIIHAKFNFLENLSLFLSHNILILS